MKSIFFLLSILFAVSGAKATSIDWSGTYRAEWFQLDRPNLAEPTVRKAYGLNSLILNPRILASDGVTIVGSFDVLANQDFTYSDSQAGQLWGQGRTGSPNADGVTDSSRHAANAETKSETALRVRELYLNIDQEYGSLVVGRAPYDFGLGLVDSAGRGSFDHWASISDVIGYKFIVGNLYFMPMIGRVQSTSYAQPGTIQDQRFEVRYESEDTGSLIGVMVNSRKVNQDMNDFPAAAIGGTSIAGDYKMSTTSLVLGRTWESFKFEMEAAFKNGSYGVRNSTGENILNNSHGVALEMSFPRPQSKWSWSMKMGMASGDNPNTADVEAFSFHRNYDVAMLMFNHRLGQRDFLQTSVLRDTTNHDVSNSIDDESISNAMFFAPRMGYAFSERWDWENTLVFGQLMTIPTGASDFKKDLGFELDTKLVYKPRNNVRWVNQLGLLAPGAAFKDGASSLDNKFTFGFETKAAVTF